jgi:Uma2 family endonuclease
MDQIGGEKFTEPPLLVVEIRSPSTALIDLNRKRLRTRGSASRRTGS